MNSWTALSSGMQFISLGYRLSNLHLSFVVGIHTSSVIYLIADLYAAISDLTSCVPHLNFDPVDS